MKICTRVVLAIILIYLTGCASVPKQDPIEFAGNTLAPKTGRVGVTMTHLPTIDTNFPGADCLLCLAVASAANSTLTDHIRTLSYEDLPKLKNNIADLLKQKGTDATVIDEDLNFETMQKSTAKNENSAYMDFSPFKQKYNIEKLLVIDINTLGVWRTYSAYIPTSDPKVVLKGTGYLVNLNDNTYEWYMPVDIMKSADGSWDEPPQFPGITNAYYQALELGKDSFMKPIKNQLAGQVTRSAAATVAPTTMNH